MDNFRSRKKHSQSIDGFVMGQKHDSFSPTDNSLGAFNQYYKPNQSGNAPGVMRGGIDAFPRSVDGFVPTTQTPIVNPADSDKPTELTDFHDEEAETQHFESHNRYGMTQAPVHEKRKRRLFSRHKKHNQGRVHSKKHRKLRLGLKLSAALGAILLLIGGGLLLRTYLASRNIFKGGGNSAFLNSQNVDPSQLKGEGDGRINILILGKGGEEQHDGPDLTDTIIVASIDPIAKEAALLSIPRDFWVKSPTGYQSKINEVYANAKYATLNTYSYKERTSDEAKNKAESAGIDALKKTVSDSMGVPLHYYVMIDFAGFRKAIDTVGGIDINVPSELAVQETMRIGGQTYYLNVKSGQQHFDGFRALAFSRSRKTSSRGDFARADRQRAVILGLKEKVLSLGTLANPIKINQLISDMEGQLSTDFSVNELLRLYDITKEISGDKVTSVGLDKLVGGSAMNGLSAQVPKAGLFDYSEIQAYVRNIMRDAFLKQENARIVILNGTSTAGLATKKSNELKSYGYNVVSVGDAPTKNYQSTVLVNLRGDEKRYTINYLEKRLNVKASATLPENNIDTTNADIVIILGADAR